ncbi:MAG: TetR/AcrR family transcriptional regulator [Oscillospiraceae bacterium]|nr:TetR/AcrR family transcriptional regulator [Oscillospiraceae bacterium]
MQEDKRVKKTKKLLKETMLSLLQAKPLEQISVKELCTASDTSRVTFYSHYADKFELVDAIFEDIIFEATDKYHDIQAANNPLGDPITSYCNMLDCILDIYYGHSEVFAHGPMDQESCSYVNYKFMQCVIAYVQHRIEKESNRLMPKYSLPKISGFITHGMWGFITAATDEGMPLPEIREQAKELLRNLLKSNILTVLT